MSMRTWVLTFHSGSNPETRPRGCIDVEPCLLLAKTFEKKMESQGHDSGYTFVLHHIKQSHSSLLFPLHAHTQVQEGLSSDQRTQRTSDLQTHNGRYTRRHPTVHRLHQHLKLSASSSTRLRMAQSLPADRKPPTTSAPSTTILSLARSLVCSLSLSLSLTHTRARNLFLHQSLFSCACPSDHSHAPLMDHQ